MTTEGRRLALDSAVAPHRLAAAAREQATYRDFLAVHRLDDTTSAVVLYLTSLMHVHGASGQHLRRSLANLDLTAAVEGRRPPSRDRDVRLYLRGAHRLAPLGPATPRCEPLYREQVRILIEDLNRPCARQLRDIACLLIVNATGVRYPAVRDLRWRDIRLTRSKATFRLPTPEGEVLQLAVGADANARISTPHVLRALKRIDGPGDGAVLAQRGDRAGSMRYRRLLSTIGATSPRRHPPGEPWTSTERLQAVVDTHWAMQTSSIRDRALIILAFLAALTNAEAANLRVRDVHVTAEGLILHMPFRPTKRVGIPAGLDPRFCPVQAWCVWRDRYEAAADAPAFPRLRPMGVRISGEPLTETGLSDVVKLRCSQAGLEGAYTFTSLRTGLIRTAIRANVPSVLIAQQAGLRQLRTIDYERDREHILTGGAAALIGL